MPSPTKTSIEEANKHLLMLHKRVEELENVLVKQSNEFSRKEREKDNYFTEQIRQKEEYCQQLQGKLLENERSLSAVHETLKEKNLIIEQLRDKSRVLDELLQCKPILESMVKLMNVYESCVSPDPSKASNSSERNAISHPDINGHNITSQSPESSACASTKHQRFQHSESSVMHL